MWKQTAQINRPEILASEAPVFDGDVTIKKQLESVPEKLVLIANIIEGPKANVAESSALQRICVNIAQLVKHHTAKKRSSSVTSSRPGGDLPLPVCIGLRAYAENSSKDLVDFLADEGLSVNYKRVLTIRKEINVQLCSQFAAAGQVYPTRTKLGNFISIAMDNIDHNPSSTTAAESFHGTYISISQHMNYENDDGKTSVLD